MSIKSTFSLFIIHLDDSKIYINIPGTQVHYLSTMQIPVGTNQHSCWTHTHGQRCEILTIFIVYDRVQASYTFLWIFLGRQHNIFGCACWYWIFICRKFGWVLQQQWHIISSTKLWISKKGERINTVLWLFRVIWFQINQDRAPYDKRKGKVYKLPSKYHAICNGFSNFFLYKFE
jgi:hypothetical protein